MKLVILKIFSSYVLFFCQIPEADVFKETKQFTYKDGPQYVFMDLVLFNLHIMWHVEFICTRVSVT